MRIHFQLTRVALTAAVAVTGLAANRADAQYNPYAQQPTPAYAPQGAYPQQAPYVGPQASTPWAPAAAQPGYGPAQQYPGSGRIAFRTNEGQLPAPAESVNPAPPAPAVYQSPPMHQPAPAAYPSAATYQPAPAVASPAYGAAPGCGCNQGAPAGAWEGYAAAPAAAPCDGGYSGAYDMSGACGYPSTCGGYSCAPAGPQRQWFFGAYGLYMERDRPSKVTTAVLVPTVPGASYYPQPGVDTFIVNTQADTDFQGGAEVRFGSTFGCATTECGCMPYQPFAWELGYWALAEDSSFTETTDAFGGPARLYGLVNYNGLEFDRDGAGGTYAYRPLNDYFDYQVPVNPASTNDVRVLAVRVTQHFQAQNLELNFWRFGAPTGPVAYAGGGLSSYGGGAGGCGTGGYGYGGACGGGCGNDCGCTADPCGAASCCGASACGAPTQRFFVSGLAGVRYLKLDETFRNAVFFDVGGASPYPGNMPTTGTNSNQVIFHDVEVDNNLLGFQLGGNMNCLVGCRWSLFADTNFGVYNNDVDTYQRVFSPGGGVVRFVQTGNAAAVRASKDDVAFLGELRLGAGYQVSKRWRATAAWRAIAISGVALAPSQVTMPINEAAWRYPDTNDSIVLHGLQAGVECKY